MSATARDTSTSRRWRTALRAGALAAALAVVAGVPLAAEAHDWDHGWRGHEAREHAWREHEWREHHPWAYGYYGPRYYGYAPSYYGYAPGYYVNPGVSLNFAIR